MGINLCSHFLIGGGGKCLCGAALANLDREKHDIVFGFARGVGSERRRQPLQEGHSSETSILTSHRGQSARLEKSVFAVNDLDRTFRIEQHPISRLQDQLDHGAWRNRVVVGTFQEGRADSDRDWFSGVAAYE